MHTWLTFIYVPPVSTPSLYCVCVCRVPRTPDPSGVSVVLHASELRRIQEASTILSQQQRREREDERKREREVAQVSSRDFPQ